MSNNYLNLNGLSIFLDKLKTIFTTKDYLNSLNLKGEKGDKGADGISVTKVEQTTASTADGGENVIRVTLSNGLASDFKVRNGMKGSTGAQGIKGETGSQGPKGDTGATGTAAGFGIPTATVDANIGTPSQNLWPAPRSRPGYSSRTECFRCRNLSSILLFRPFTSPS